MDAVAGAGWHRGWQGTQWQRVPLEIQESGRLSLGVAGDELGRVSLIGGPDFDCVTATVRPRQILLGSGGPGRRSPAPTAPYGKRVR